MRVLIVNGSGKIVCGREMVREMERAMLGQSVAVREKMKAVLTEIYIEVGLMKRVMLNVEGEPVHSFVLVSL